MKQCRYIMINLVLLTIVSLFFLIGCDDRNPSSSQSSSGKSISQTDSTQADTNEITTHSKFVWPFSGDQTDEKTELASDLLAKNYILVFDGSGSMSDIECGAGQQKIVIARHVVSQWSKTVPEDANLGLVAFHSPGWETLPLKSGDRAQFNQTINLLIAGGRTPLYNALVKAYEIATLQGRKQLGYGEYTIVIVTDGIADHPEHLSRYVDFLIEKTPINIYSIGFCIGKNHSLKQQGRTIYKSANNPAELTQGLQDVLAESESFDSTEFD